MKQILWSRFWVLNCIQQCTYILTPYLIKQKLNISSKVINLIQIKIMKYFVMHQSYGFIVSSANVSYETQGKTICYS